MKPLHEHGFTLVELMGGLAVALVVVAAGFTALTSSHKATRIADMTVATQQNVRVAMELLSRDLQVAGYGMTNPVGQCATPIVPADNNPAGPDTGPDRISIVVPVTSTTAPPWTLGIPAVGPTPTITVAGGAGAAMAAEGLTPASNVLSSQISIGGALVTTVTAMAGDVLTLGTTIPAPAIFPVGTPVYLLQCVTYQIIAPGDPNAAVCGGNPPCLVRGVAANVAAPRDCNTLPNTCVAVADGIEDLQIAYGCDGCNAAVNGGVEDRTLDDQDGIAGFTGGDFLSNTAWAAVPTTPTTIRVVRLGLVGRQLQGDQGLGEGRAAGVSTAGPVVVDPDHNSVNGVFVAGDYEASTYLRLRHRTLTRTIQLRNLGQ